MTRYNVNGYRIHADHSITLTQNITNISYNKALYYANLWRPLCEKLEIIETNWAIRLDANK